MANTIAAITTTTLLLLAAGAVPSECFSSLPTTHRLASPRTSSTAPLSLSEELPPPSRSAARPPSKRRSTTDRTRRPPPGNGVGGRSRPGHPRRPPRSEARGGTATTSAAEPKRRRAPHQFDHTKEEARPFLEGTAEFVRTQDTNEGAPTYAFSDHDDETAPLVEEGMHLVSMSLDDLFPGLGFSEKFSSPGDGGTFRTAVRNAMREDIFSTTPAYAGMSEKARRMLLLPDSSLQGSWNCRRQSADASVSESHADAEDASAERNVGNGDNNGDNDPLRMLKLTEVLSSHLGPDAPTGDEFMETIGGLCGPRASHHWIDIVGIVDRRIPHSWHQDAGRSPDDLRTVMLGFPAEDNYDGPGVFSHAVKLKRKRITSDGRATNEPVVYHGLKVDEEYVVRPRFARGKEILIFRDVDVLHSAPDVAYRASAMRFM